MSQRRIIDIWQGGSSPYHQYVYRLSLDSSGDYLLEVRPMSSPDIDASYSLVGHGSAHRVAREVAALLRDEHEQMEQYNARRGRGVLRRFAM